MIALHFVPTKFSRSTTRAQWREIDRWRRVMQKKLGEETQRQINDFVVFGSTMLPRAREDLLYRMTNPPLLVHDKQKLV